MRDLEPYMAGEKTGRVVGLTFDDGYQNNLVHALPVLQRHGFSATCYGVSTLLGGSNVWDQGEGIAQKPLMTRQEWLAWQTAGMEIGSHGRSHADLTTLPLERAALEIQQSKTELEAAFGRPVLHFCYPYGRYHAAHRDLVLAAGYRSATTTRRGRVHAAHDPFALNRIMVARACNPLQFAAKLLTRYEDNRG